MRGNVKQSGKQYSAALKACWPELREACGVELREPPKLHRLVREYDELTDDEVAIWGALGKSSLHFFSMFVLGYDRLTPQDGAHGELCEYLEGTFAKPTFLMAHRSFFKSTIGAICRPLWGAVRDPENYDHIHLVDDLDLGRSQMSAIAGHVRSNPRLNRLYPELAPKRGEWAPKDGLLTLDARPDWKTGFTFEMLSTRESLAGRHVRDMTLDDWVSEVNCTSVYEQERMIDKFTKMWPAIDTDNLLICGTPYTPYDVWSHVLREFYPEDLEVMLWPLRGRAWIDEKHEVAWEDGEEYPIPHEWDDERYRRERRHMSYNLAYFELQYHLSTKRHLGRGFKREWLLHRPMPDLRWFTRYIAFDPAPGESEGGKSRPAIAVIGINRDGEMQIIDANDTYTSEAEAIDALFELYDVYRPLKVGVEVYAAGGRSTWTQIKRQCQLRGVYMPLEEQRHHGSTKNEHIIATLRAPYEWGSIWHNSDLRDGRFEQQLVSFPEVQNDDLLDSVAYAVDLALEFGYRGPVSVEDAGANAPRIGPTLEKILHDKLHSMEEKKSSVKAGYW